MNKFFFTHHALPLRFTTGTIARTTLFALLILVLTACANSQPSSIADTIEYRGTKFGFRLSYPSQWQMLEDAPPLVGDSPTILHAVTLQPPQDSKSLVIVYIQTLTTTQTLDEYAAQQMISLRENEAGATFTDLSTVQLGGLAARATSAADDKSQLRKMVMTINNSKAYALLLFGPASAELAAQFEKVLQSFSFLP
jgi:hypothetical protein